MEIFHIGTPDRKLLSIFYPGNEACLKKMGVVICNPLGQEYVRFYKALAVLATELSKMGFPTFRFDYWGSGDSFGDEDELNMDSTTEDLQLVINEMREGTEIEKICLLGVRYGSFLSLAAFDKIKPSALVLWNPVLCGKEYILEIAQLHESFLSGSFALKRHSTRFESLGFSYATQFVKSVSECQPQPMGSQEAIDILISADESWLEKNNKKIAELFSGKTPQLNVNRISKFFLKQEEDENKLLVPIIDINKIIDWLIKIQ
ncbi:serine aminopeptidase domain-containing protein [Pedobacter jejuensis]|uniref:Serine aminopeptidase S33 domain-containing protein n=1 Tax=Pedobacter jejuensis TaxID=1268550 RepID=A0A3N0BWX4_9SPHI|nr:alpha/beta hydrolase [Pedobacter jejuensis]RNL53960.1 hypothetical protein D7004_07620 [Pedobacter jejuensis]